MAPPNPADPPPVAGEGDEGRANLIVRAAESYLETVEPAAREAILADRDALQVNPGRIPARHYARADDKSFEGLFRSILADHKGLAKDITESDFRKALQTLREAPVRSDPGEVRVSAPTHFGQQDLKKEDLDAWRRFNSDSKGGLDLRSLFEYVCSYHEERGNIFSEDSLRRHLYILVPKNHMTSLAWKVKRMYSLQKIFDECLLAADNVKTEEELRNDIEKTLDNPKDVLEALRKTMELLEQCPNGGDTLDQDCLREAKRLVKRLGGPNLSNQVLALFQNEQTHDFSTYYAVIKKYFTEILKELTQKPKGRAHAIDEIPDIPDEKGAPGKEGRPIQTSTTPPAQPGPSAQSSLEETKLLLQEILSKLNGPTQQVSNLYPVVQQVAPAQNQGGARPKSKASNKKKKNRSRDGYSYHVANMPYKDRPCALHENGNHTNSACARQQAVPCALHADHSAAWCPRLEDAYYHPPALVVYNSDSPLAKQACLAAGGVVSQGNRSTHRGRGGHYDHRPPQHPMALTSPAPMALAGPPSYGVPTQGQPAMGQPGPRADPHGRLGQVNAVAEKLAELTTILKGMDD